LVGNVAAAEIDPLGEGATEHDQLAVAVEGGGGDAGRLRTAGRTDEEDSAVGVEELGEAG
jgi:hypothetical protein